MIRVVLAVKTISSRAQHKLAKGACMPVTCLMLPVKSSSALVTFVAPVRGSLAMSQKRMQEIEEEMDQILKCLKQQAELARELRKKIEEQLQRLEEMNDRNNR